MRKQQCAYAPVAQEVQPLRRRESFFLQGAATPSALRRRRKTRCQFALGCDECIGTPSFATGCATQSCARLARPLQSLRTCNTSRRRNVSQSFQSAASNSIDQGETAGDRRDDLPPDAPRRDERARCAAVRRDSACGTSRRNWRARSRCRSWATSRIRVAVHRYRRTFPSRRRAAWAAGSSWVFCRSPPRVPR